jgi:putative transposase
MSANQARFPIATMARVLGVSEAGYHAWRYRPPSAQAVPDATLLKRVRTVHASSRETYGARRVHAQLRADGARHGRKRIARLMRQARLLGASRRRTGVTTTRRDKDARPAPDLVDRNFVASKPNQLWVADITFVPTASGFLYLAVVLDAWSRKIVGWSMANHLRAELVVAALEMAIGQRRPGDVIHHSDQGSQGGFNWSSQHLDEGGCDERSDTLFGSGASRHSALARPAKCCATRGPSAVLGVDSSGAVERGCGGCRRSIIGGRGAVVSGGGRHATIDPCAVVQAALRTVSIAHGTGGDCAVPGAGPGGAGDCPPSGAISIDDLAGTATQCSDPQRWPRLPRDHRAVAC